MDTLLDLLAVTGGVAAAWHLARAALRFLGGGASGIWAEEMARTHARRGDLTALDETERERLTAARGARRAALGVAGWLALLAVPTLTPWPRSLYAAYTLLWAGPAMRRVRGARRRGR